MGTKLAVDCSGTLPEADRVIEVEMTPEELAEHAEAQEAAQAHVTEMYRMHRNGMLAASDWTQIPDAPLTDAKRKAWATYRQKLRDMDFTGGEPTWPKPPKS